MKQYTPKILASIKIIILATFLAVGVQYISASWTSAISAPPTCATGNPGCDAPLNVGLSTQSKLGSLSLNTDPSTQYPIGLIVFGSIQLPTGAGAGKVLTSDANGNASWQSPQSHGTVVFDTSGSWTVPVGVTLVKVKMWGAGGSGADGGSAGGGGGGGGAYGEKQISLTPGVTNYQVVIGGPGTQTTFGGNLVVVNAGASGASSAGGRGGTVVGTQWSLSPAGTNGTNGSSAFSTGCGPLGTFTQPGNGGPGGVSYTPSTAGAGGTYPVCNQGATTPAIAGTLGGGGGGDYSGGQLGAFGGPGKVIIEY